MSLLEPDLHLGHPFVFILCIFLTSKYSRSCSCGGSGPDTHTLMGGSRGGRLGGFGGGVAVTL